MTDPVIVAATIAPQSRRNATFALQATFNNGEQKVLFSFCREEPLIDTSDLLGLSEIQVHRMRYWDDIMRARTKHPVPAQGCSA